MAAAVDKANVAADDKVPGPTKTAPYKCIKCAFGMPGCIGSGTRSATVTTFSITKTSTTQVAKAENDITRKTLAPGPDQALASVSHDKNNAAPTFDAESEKNRRSSCIGEQYGSRRISLSDWRTVELGRCRRGG